MEGINLEKALELLNEKLEKRDFTFELVTCGGALMILAGYSNRATGDMDVLAPEFSKEFLECTNEVAKELGYRDKWINDSVKVYIRDFPSGWEKRVEDLRNFSHLKLKGISRQDLISNKLKAYVDRGFDADDLNDLKPTREEFNTSLEFVKSFELSQTELVELDIIEGELFD